MSYIMTDHTKGLYGAFWFTLNENICSKCLFAYTCGHNLTARTIEKMVHWVFLRHSTGGGCPNVGPVSGQSNKPIIKHFCFERIGVLHEVILRQILYSK